MRKPDKSAKQVLTPDQYAELEALDALPDDKINTRDMPEQRNWVAARRGVFYDRKKAAHHLT